MYSYCLLTGTAQTPKQITIPSDRYACTLYTVYYVEIIPCMNNNHNNRLSDSVYGFHIFRFLFKYVCIVQCSICGVFFRFSLHLISMKICNIRWLFGQIVFVCKLHLPDAQFQSNWINGMGTCHSAIIRMLQNSSDDANSTLDRFCLSEFVIETHT